MALPPIFCPQCNTLILKADQCPRCEWQRPAQRGKAGQIEWAVALETQLPRQGSRPVAANGIVYFVTDQGQIVALDTHAASPETAIQWRYQPDSKFKHYGPAIWQDTLLLGAEYEGGFPKPPADLVMISASQAQELWPKITGCMLSISSNGKSYGGQKSVPNGLGRRPRLNLRRSGLLILPNRGHSLLAFDTATHKLAWTFTGNEWFPHTPSFIEGVVYARCWDKHIYALNASDGQELWRYKPDRDYNSEPWLDQDYLYVGVKDYQQKPKSGKKRSRSYALYILDRLTRERVARYPVFFGTI